ncbi:TetR/AcrR family transcriptional regulator [Flavobacterium piscinae]|jgi:AcrR family transcriptional regulator|uniref:TetR/AcrR family transcriptional regulator n=1 Tax=Flavobacterium piscinae TaxID=2506424 RepID=A0A4V1N3S5_9FLAO|nr:TetR/AcrR family transcriptional regulator [Flavobacterium piscinae]RXR29686.1 TetR/AcrR family transcriptional regulator [Flavobacterium piscinae]
MKNILEGIKINISPKIYVKDPETSELGKKIIENSILLIDEIGFDNFTFKKLGQRIGSNESSIYRYFESKHKLLLYLTSWYWGWLEFKLVLSTNNISNPQDKLIKAIEIVTEEIITDSNHPHINEIVLHKIIICEFSKSYLTKEVDEENKEGYFLIYKRVINRIIEMVKEVNPSFPFAKSLVSTLVEGALHQHFLKVHFKSITDCSEKNTPTEFFKTLVLKQIS